MLSLLKFEVIEMAVTNLTSLFRPEDIVPGYREHQKMDMLRNLWTYPDEKKLIGRCSVYSRPSPSLL